MINGFVIPVAIERRKRLHILNSKRKNNTTVVNIVNELARPQTENCKERNPHEELTKIILCFDGQINQLASTLNISFVAA